MCGVASPGLFPRIPGLESSWSLSQGSVSPALDNLGEVQLSLAWRGRSLLRPHASQRQSWCGDPRCLAPSSVSLQDQLREVAGGGGERIPPGVVGQAPMWGSLCEW